MSHIVSITTQVRDPIAIAAACRRLSLTEPIEGKAQLYAGEVSGWIVQLPGWKYPVAIETATGALHFDHFNGQWGIPDKLDRFLQAYACEAVHLEARRQGHAVTEQPLADGSIKLTIALP